MTEFETNGPTQPGIDAKYGRRPIWILDRETGRFLWANGEGLAFWAARGLEDLQKRSFAADHPAWQAIVIAFQSQDTPQRLSLTFPEKTSDCRYAALCRLGVLKDRGAVVVEIIETLPTSLQAERPTLSGDVIASAAKSLSNGVMPHDDFKGSVLGRRSSEREALKTLGSLIKQAADDETELPASSVDQGRDNDAPGLDPERDLPSDVEAPQTGSTETIWDALPLDLTALKGVADEDEVDALFAHCPWPVALIYLNRILHANAAFVSEFGYGDIDGLGNDGTDWIFPQSRDRLRRLYPPEGGQQTRGADVEHEGVVLEDIRLCSGRRLHRPVYVMPQRLVKFNRVFLLVTLGPPLSPDHSPFDSSTQFKPGPDAGALLSFIGHEVRNPLNIIHGFAQLLEREEFGPIGHEKYSEYARDIVQSSELALSLINDFLDLGKIRAGHWQLQPQPLELNDIVRQQVHLMREMAASATVKLRSCLEENLPKVTADRRALQQILLNLISNALKFSPAGGVVMVETELSRDGFVCLRVKDQGPGLSKADLASVLQPFRQTEQGHQHQGSGLGLPIVQELATLSGFEFDIKSDIGRGTDVELRLPG